MCVSELDGLRFFKALFVSYGVICLQCLPLLAIWTSLKSNVSMVNWLADCRFDLDYRIVWRVGQNTAKPTNLLQVWLTKTILHHNDRVIQLSLDRFDYVLVCDFSC